MIKTNGNNLYYNTNHLLLPKPDTYTEIIERLKKLECNLFYNIVSSPTCRYERYYSEGRISDHYKTMKVEERFKNIFFEKKLYANPKSYFVNKVKDLKPKNCDFIKSVSFALSDFRELKKHFEARGSEFGICFFHDFLQNKGLRPVEYINECDDEKIKDLIFNSPHLLEVYGKRYDMRWENEWRINSTLEFVEDDIAFVIVPEDRYEFFAKWFMNHENFPNVNILSANVYTSFVDHLITHPQHSTNNWNQVELFGEKYHRGYKIDPDMFNELTKEERKKFQLDNYEDLECLAKNTILSNYEYAYTGRFLNFTKLLNHKRLDVPLVSNYKLIQENNEEPFDSERDLVKALFEGLYQMYGSKWL